ncbi:MAG: TolB family protein [Ilumatobacteraceae bacterium]
MPIGTAHAAVTDTERVSVGSGTTGDRDHPSISDDGSLAVFAAYNTASRGIWLRDIAGGDTYRITTGSDSEPVISGDGTTVAYVHAGTHPSVWVIDVSDPANPGTPERVDLVDGLTTGANNDSGHPSISDDGNEVAFDSMASNLVPGTTLPATGSARKVYVRDRSLDTTEIVSVDGDGDVLTGEAMNPDISGDGNWVAFASHQDLTQLHFGVGSLQVFVYDRDADAVALASVNDDGDEGFGDSAATNAPSISDDGMLVTFESAATNLVPFDSNGRTDVFVHDFDSDTTTRVSERKAFDEFGPFTAATPHRLLDTRVSGVAMASGETRSLTIAGSNEVPDDATAVTLNVTIVSSTVRSHLTVFPKGETRPNASSINAAPGRAIANAVTSALGDDGAISIYNLNGPVHVIVDLTGYFTPDSLDGGGGFVSMAPERLVDTRLLGGALASETSRSFDVAGMDGVPDTATAVALTVVAVNPTARGHLRVYPGDTTRPGTSSVNFLPGQNTSNSVIVGIGDDGTIDVYNSAGTTHLVIDVYGFFDPASVNGGFTGITPHRLLDTRTDVGPLVGETAELDVVGHAGVPADATTAVMLNVTVVNPTTNGRLKVFPTGSALPTASAFNFQAGVVRASQVVVAVGDLGRVSFESTFGSVDVVVDIVGWFSGVQFAEGGSNPVISNDGSVVAFESLTSSVDLDDSNDVVDVFLSTLATNDVERVSLPASGGTEASGTRTDPETGLTVDSANGMDPVLGDDGSFVAYVSNGDLTDDRAAGEEVSAVYLSTRAA